MGKINISNLVSNISKKDMSQFPGEYTEEFFVSTLVNQKN